MVKQASKSRYSSSQSHFKQHQATPAWNGNTAFQFVYLCFEDRHHTSTLALAAEQKRYGSEAKCTHSLSEIRATIILS